MEAFDDVAFPLAIGRGAQVSPGFSTTIVTTASGREQRNAAWSSGRLRFDAGPGVRSEADIGLLIAFFRARRGAAKAFRFRDPFDHAATDQLLGTGDGIATRFALVKRYGVGNDAEVRRITRPVAAGLTVKVNGTVQPSGWTLADKGVIEFALPPALAATVSASFSFDVPVRFASDQLDIDMASFAAGDAPNVELVEVRED